MEILKTKNADVLTLALVGRLDTTTSPELETVLKNELDDVTQLEFDFEKLDYISSAGLRVLLGAHKSMLVRGTMKVIHPNEAIREVFDITGFSDILTIE